MGLDYASRIETAGASATKTLLDCKAIKIEQSSVILCWNGKHERGMHTFSFNISFDDPANEVEVVFLRVRVSACL